MTDEHWFDAFSKAAVQATTRRGVVRSAAALVPSLLLGGEVGVAAGKKKGGKKKNAGKKGSGNKKKDNGNKNDKDKRKNEKPKRKDPCKSSFPAIDDQKDCKWHRRNCPLNDPPQEYCIIRSDAGALVPVCCPPADECCGNDCVHLPSNDYHCGVCDNLCTAGETCQHGQCVSACGPNSTICRGTLEGCCREGNNCCPGVGCKNLTIDSENCSACGHACDPGEVCRDRNCVCEGPGCPQACLDQNCPPGQLCYNGNNQYCSGLASIDCQCGCGGSNYCPHPQLGWVCQSNPC